MKNALRLILAIWLLFYAIPASAAPDLMVNWTDLPDPSVQNYEDPYRDLSPEQFDDLLFVVRTRARLQKDIGSAEERQNWQELLLATEDALAADGVDVDWVLSQREIVTQRRKTAATAGNPELDGQTVTLAGFAIPAPPDADGRPVAYLVPERGMCSHMPPPKPNQMIRVHLSGDWIPQRYHEPVRLTGRLSIEPSAQQMVVVDGLMPMRATFRMDATDVVQLGSAEDAEEARRSLLDRLRAAGHNKTGGVAATD